MNAKGIIDGTGTDLKENISVIIENGVITSIKQRQDFQPLEEYGYELINLPNDYLLPGFIDSHSHGPSRPGDGDQIGQNKEPSAISALRSAKNLQDSLKSGVTSMRLMNSNENLDVYLRQAIDEGEIVGPRLYISGGAIKPSSSGSYNAVNSPEDIKKSIRNSKAVDADVIKIFCDPGNYTKDEVQLAVDEAHKLGLRISAHALTEDQIRMCVECGVDSIEHGGKMSDETLDLMKEKGIYWVLTNTIFFHEMGLPKVDYQVSKPGTKQAEIEKKLMLEACINIEKYLPKALLSGVNFSCGTDGMHGLFPYEMEFMVKNGATPMEAIVAATRNGALLIGSEDHLGTLEVGKFADIISVPSNPLEDIRVMWNVNLVMKNGERYY